MFTSHSLDNWLQYIESVHPQTIDMGLARTKQVQEKLNLKPQCPVITVSGTNGKGSVCAYLTAIYHEAGFKVGTLTSPHLIRFNERIAINAEPVTDELIIQAFEAIEQARGDIPLTYFEFNTLAAVWVFAQQQTDVMVLEVGLGGRLDAVNVFDTDCAIITSVDIDHQDYLGTDLETIGFEKAGIFRSNKPAIFGQQPLLNSVNKHAHDIDAQLLCYDTDFSIRTMDNQWDFLFKDKARHALPIPTMRGTYQIQNASCALAAIECLYEQLPVTIGAIKRGLIKASNTGRFQILPGRPMVILDVGHNPHAARALVKSLNLLPFASKKIAVFSMLADKDIDEVIEICKGAFDEWFIAPLNVPRAVAIDVLHQKLNTHGIKQIQIFENIETAYQHALSCAQESDRITVFGSFHTVAEILTQHTLK
ncbi:bifunctional tetrahydrofolate synthase/dihydrofolate synthase [Neisseria sp. Ec49-e6-T10]|uniref:bifunctional tetrahydrofolate synthase/dihydrofolate synthase n=1 Tax=Neisseria sp. Ec49-e6-T10 TaxID=3140744 RepID=UPI003EBF8C8B